MGNKIGTFHHERASAKQKKHAKRMQKAFLIGRRAVDLAKEIFDKDLDQGTAQRIGTELLKNYENGGGNYSNASIIAVLTLLYKDD